MEFGLARSLSRALRLASLALLASSLLTQPSFSQATAAGSGAPAVSRVDIFGGYTYFRPFKSDIDGNQYPTIPLGAIANADYYFGRHFGVQVEGQFSPRGSNDFNCAYTGQGGPVVRFQHGRFVPFAHILGGGAVVGGPRAQQCNVWGWGGTGGGGLDYILPVLHDHLAVRPIQGDVLYSHIDNGPLKANGFYGGQADITAFRLSAGIVYRFGRVDPLVEEPAFNCSADPGNPYPGDAVTLTASTMNLPARLHPNYIWTSSAGKVTGSGPTATIDTTGMGPGSYTVAGKLVEGAKQRVVASCTASFTVQALQPPTIACSVDKAAINSGTPINVIATARSPQNRPLTYTYATTAGVITPNGATAALSTVGIAPGNVTVTCGVTDDKGQRAAATAFFVVATPAPPPAAVLPHVQNLCAITFDRDLKRPDRVDNAAKGCLDDVALTMNRDTTAKLVLIGSHADKETNRNAAERAMNAAQYLTQEKGVDPTRLDLRIGPDNSRAVAMMLVPPGASLDSATASSFDTSSVKRTGQAYGVPRNRTTPTRKTSVRHRTTRTAAPKPATRRRHKKTTKAQ